MGIRGILTHTLVAIVACGAGAWLVSSRIDHGPELTATDPVGRLIEIHHLADPAERARALVDFFAEADPADAPTLLEALKEDPEVLPDEMTEILFASWWAQSDPEAAFEKRINPPWVDRHPWMRTVVATWVYSDPNRVAEGVMDLSVENPAHGRVEAAQTLLDRWFDATEEDPVVLLQIIQTLEVKPRTYAMRQYLNALVDARGLDGAEQFVESIALDKGEFDMNVRNEILGRMGSVIAAHDIERAKRWAEKHGQGRQGAGVLRYLAYYWGTRDGPAAMEWVLGLPDTPHKRQTVKRTYISFLNRDKEGATEWISQHEPVADLEVVLVLYLKRLATSDPRAALDHANRSETEEMRNRLYVVIGRSWMRTDPTAAQAWLLSAGLPLEVQGKILQSASTEVPPPADNAS